MKYDLDMFFTWIIPLQRFVMRIEQTTTFSFEGINQRGITQKQDKGLSWDFPAILVEFSPDVAWKQTKLS